MSDILRYLLMALVPISLVLLAIFAFWIALPVIILGVAARIIYLRFFRRGKDPAHTHTVGTNWHNSNVFGGKKSDQEYTTVIDADNMEREYRIPKMK
ncbi:hypothetical protein LPY66_14295 [Dehalobacter sp. DCM]|uniref:hypothetical protein n=1 Tax=Dehalobacter sp. DCM TaxID=2907827 RepID=UPI00308185FF|nr:hypothetical protein LPY66_14295 [Dehalobacter sp. DCM]